MKAFKTSSKQWSYFVGIDISKDELDIALLKDDTFLFHQEYKNETKDIAQAIKILKQIPGFKIAKAIFCMEDTGIYNNHLVEFLVKIKASIVVENGLRIKRTLGMVRGKSDKTDAIRIAEYASRFRGDLVLLSAKRPVLQQLSDLLSLRSKLVVMSDALGVRLKEQSGFKKKALHEASVVLCKDSVQALKGDIAKVERSIDRLFKADESLNRMHGLITSIPGVGMITATQIIVSTNEFKNFSSAKKFACYAGVAPFLNESGKSIGKARISKMANQKIKRLLHLCAMTAITRDGEIKAYYQRKVEGEGKSKMSVLNAVRNKLVLRIFACVKANRPFEKNYVRAVVDNDLQQVY